MRPKHALCMTEAESRQGNELVHPKEVVGGLRLIHTQGHHKNDKIISKVIYSKYIRRRVTTYI